MSDTDEAPKAEAAGAARSAPQRVPGGSGGGKPLREGERAELRAGVSGTGGARLRAVAQPPDPDVRL